MTKRQLIKELEKYPAEIEIRVEGSPIGSRNTYHDSVRCVYLKNPYKTYTEYVVIQGGPFGSIEKIL